MAKEIKQKIVLEGEQQYKKALKDARSELTRLKGEMKAEAAEMARNATEQEKAAKKGESLRKQIAEQEKIVKTLNKALAEAKEKYGDNTEVINKWENQYNNARKTLADMKNELDGLGDGFEKVRKTADSTIVATKSVADALGSIGTAGANVSSAIESIFTGMINKTREVLTELWGLVVDVSGRANGWADTAEFWGTDAATIEKWEHAVKGAHNEFSALTNVMSRLTLGGKDKEIAEYLGISSEGYENQWAFGIAAMEQLETLKNENNKRYLDAMAAIFGEKKSQDIMDLVNDWGTIKGNLGTFDAENGGYGMTNAEIESMSKLAEQISLVDEKINALKTKFAAGLGALTGDLVINVSGGLDAIQEYFGAEDDAGREAALQKLRENLEEFLRKVVAIIGEAAKVLNEMGEDLKKSDVPLLKTVGEIFTAIADGLEWLVNNEDGVKKALEGIFGAWLTGQLLAVAGQLTSIIANINVIKGFKAPNLTGGGPNLPTTGTGNILSTAAAAAKFVASQPELWMGLAGAGVVAALGHSVAEAGKLNEERKEDVGFFDFTPAQQLAALNYYKNRHNSNASTRDEGFTMADTAYFDLEEAVGEEMAKRFNKAMELWHFDDPSYNAEERGLNFQQLFTNPMDIPAGWWTSAIDWQNAGTPGGKNGEDLSALPGTIGAAVATSVSGAMSQVQVKLDGQKVGTLVAPYVSQQIARDVVY